MRLRTFGTLALIDDASGGDVRLQRRQLAMLAVLAVEGPAGVTRDRLHGMFGADREPERARHAVDQMLYAARRVLGADAIVSGPVAVRLDDAMVTSDVREFTSALARGDLAAAASANTGAFLDGVFLNDAPEFERWAEGRRAYFAGALVQVLTRLAASATAAGDNASAVSHLRRAATTDPLSAAVTHALMLALIEHGDQSAALSTARVYTALVREQLDAEPDRRVTELEQELRAGRVRRAPLAAAPVARGAAPGSTPLLETPVPSPTGSQPAHRRPRKQWMVAGVSLTILATLAVVLLLPHRRAAFTARDATQLTASGDSRIPALSPDGRYVAYTSRKCEGDERCVVELDLQELGGSATRRVVEGATFIDYIAWSPDSRTLLFHGTAGAPEGFYVVSALGSGALFLRGRFASFYAGGDSLMLLESPGATGVTRVFVAGLDGTVRDSFPLAAADSDLAVEELYAVANSPWILVSRQGVKRSVIGVIDRRGREVSRRAFASRAENLRASRGAVWAAMPLALSSMVVRIPFDARTGQLSPEVDTVQTGSFIQFDVSSNGDLLVIDRETFVHDLWAMSLAEAERGDFSAGKRLARASMGIDASLSPDGKRVLIARAHDALVNGGFRFTSVPFDSGAEQTLPTGNAVSARWAWNGTLEIAEQGGDTTRLMLLDPVTGQRRGPLAVAAPYVRWFAARSSGGWAWITSDGQGIRTQAAGQAAPTAYAKDAWYESVGDLRASPDGKRVVFWGMNAARDSASVTVISLADGSRTVWWSGKAPSDMIADWLDDRSVALRVWETPERLVILRLDAPGRVVSRSVIPHRTIWLELSADMQRIVAITRVTRGDVWISRIERK